MKIFEKVRSVQKISLKVARTFEKTKEFDQAVRRLGGGGGEKKVTARACRTGPEAKNHN